MSDVFEQQMIASAQIEGTSTDKGAVAIRTRRLTDQLAISQQTLGAVEARANSLAEENARLKMASKERQALINQAVSLDVQLANMTRERDESWVELNRLTSYCVHLEEENVALHDHIERENVTLEDTEDNIARLKEELQTRPLAPEPTNKAERLTKPWFVHEVLAASSSLFERARLLVNVADGTILLEARNKDRTAFLRANFPPVAGVTSEAWTQIKAKNYQPGNVQLAADQAVISNIPWDQTYGFDEVTRILSQHNEKILPVTALGIEGTWGFDRQILDRLMRKKPELIKVSQKYALGALRKRDGITYEYWLRANQSY